MFLNLEGPRGAGHRRARRRGRGAQGRDRRASCAACATTSGGDDRRSAKRSTPPALYCGPVSRERARSHHRLQRRLSHVVGLRDRRRGGAGVRGQHQGVERRPLHRSAPGARRVLLQPRDRPRPTRRSSTSRRRRCACSASSRRRTWTAGRSAVGRSCAEARGVRCALARRWSSCRSLVAVLVAVGCGGRSRAAGKRVIVLGFDGLTTS